MEKKLRLVYVVDDEPNIRKLASLALKEYGYDTREFENGTDLLKAVEAVEPDAIVLDWVMPPPGPDGLSVCGRLKLNPDTKFIPIIMLTARAEEVDCVLALEMGTDDYLTKPFSLKELCARVKALIRRREYTIPNVESDVLVADQLAVNLSRRTVTKNGVPVDLTMKEFDLLTSLMKSKGKVLNRDQLMTKVWDVEFCGDARTVDVHIRYLRQKIEDEPELPRYILTTRGIGYRFASEEELKGM